VIDARDSAIRTLKRIPPIDWSMVSFQHRVAFKDHISALCQSLKDCEGLVAWFGDADFCPFQPVILMIPGSQPVAIAGAGYATAAELRDCAVTYWETTVNRVASGSVLDFDTLRERAGMASRDKADELIREALWERAKRHQASPVTDPMRQPVYPNPTGKIHFPEHPGVPYEVNHDE
jgi:hypothetical protein